MISITRNLFALSAFVVVASCAGLYNDYDDKNPDPFDRQRGLNRKDYINQLLPQPAEKELKVETKTPPVPKASDMILAPAKPRLGISKTVSLSVTEDVPLKDVFIELARLADIDIEVDSAISGGVIFKAKNRPFDEVVERITDLAGLRYTVNNGVLRIQRDTPYIENYPVDFLNIVRSNNGSIEVNTKVLSGGGSSSSSSSSSSGGGGGGSGGDSGGGGGGLTTGSSASIKSEYDGDLWASVENDINAIIGTSGGGKGGAATKSAGSSSSGGEAQPFVSVNRQAGMITVMATDKQHGIIREYLQKVRDYASAQVLIEAKIVEVSLDDQFKSGINWADINIGKINLGLTNTGLTTSGTSTLGPAGSIGVVSGDIDVAMQFAQSFGTTRTLSSPRIMVLNNQQAVLSFATNIVYFTIDINDQSSPSNSTTGGLDTNQSIKSSPQTVPIGIILTLQPSINTATSDIIMNIRPTLSRLSGPGKEDPAVALYNAKLNLNSQVSSVIPEIEVREMDSVLRVKSGQVMAIGGMIEQRLQNNDSGLPYAQEVPLVGNLFKSVDKQTKSVQTVIFLKATVVPGYGVDESDQKLYNKFNNDPRPIGF